MDGSNPPLVTDAPVEFENQAGEVQECRKITDHSRRIYGIYLKLMKGNRRIVPRNRLALETLGSPPIVLKNLPELWCQLHSPELSFNEVKATLPVCRPIRQSKIEHIDIGEGFASIVS